VPAPPPSWRAPRLTYENTPKAADAPEPRNFLRLRDIARFESHSEFGVRIHE
jgi:hypothetical protein